MTAHPYIPNSAPEARSAMLRSIGAADVEEFFADVPAALRLEQPLQLPEPLRCEQELVRHVEGLLARNTSTRGLLSFLGAGTYPHFVPAVVDEVIGRSEFLTAYAGEPYEDHGRFQALFEYQSLMGELLEMDVVNVPTYDGLQAAATALLMATRITGRRQLLLASPVLPDLMSRVEDYVRPHADLFTLPVGTGGTVHLDALRDSVSQGTAAVWVQTPDATGVLEPGLADVARIAHAVGALLVVGTDPACLGVVASPATQGADIVCGDIQSLGVHQWFGGGHAGFIAVHDDPRFVMELPSRLFGLATTDVPGEYGFGDVAYERTSFALREEGKEWVGTAAALWGIAAAVYLTAMGPSGMAQLGETVLSRTRYAITRVGEVPGLRVEHARASHFREFVVDTSDSGRTAPEIVSGLRRRGIEPGVVLADHRLLVCVTEVHSAADIDRLVAALADESRQEGAGA
jgi:glycine dehydrogenase subunit 1